MNKPQRVIKKYPNRRLYDTANSGYITLADVKKMMLTPDLWKQFLQMQAPAMQGMLGSYLEQSAKLFMDMQQRMQDQTRGLFTAFPFPNFSGPQGSPEEDKKR